MRVYQGVQPPSGHSGSASYLFVTLSFPPQSKEEAKRRNTRNGARTSIGRKVLGVRAELRRPSAFEDS